MKQLLFFCVASFLLFACGSPSTETATKDSSLAAPTAEAEKKSEPAINYPYTAEYSSDFKVGDPNHAKTVLDMYKMFDAGNISGMRPSFSDSVRFIFADGTDFKVTGDSLIKIVSKLRGAFKAINNKITAWMPLHSNDRNEDWVLIWAREIRTSNKNVTDSSELHELWHMNNGKIDEVFQYEQKIPKKK